MKWQNVIILIVASVFILIAYACGDEAKELVIPTKIVKGTVGGCQIEAAATNLRVGVMGKDGEDLIEVASTDIDPAGPVYSINLNAEPPLNLNWVAEEDGTTQHTEFLVYTYLDINGDGEYTFEDDGDVLGVGATRIHFFNADYEPLSAAYGYNVLVTNGGGYTQEFSESVFVTAGGCTDGDTEE